MGWQEKFMVQDLGNNFPSSVAVSLSTEYTIGKSGSQLLLYGILFPISLKVLGF